VRAFIVRPLGTRCGVDFDFVERELIAPALRQLGIDSGITAAVIDAGRIRDDVFERLVTSDLVVADITTDSPDAGYALGIRHALREKRTFLLRGGGLGADMPFALRSDRSLVYDPATPADALATLCEGLAATLASDQPDSPVFRMCSELRGDGRSHLTMVPAAFRDELDSAVRSGWWGRVALLGHEAKAAPWEVEGLRLVAREQLDANACEAAAVTLEDLRLALGPREQATPRTILFTGHRIDEPGRKEPRFPPEKEAAARGAIREVVQREAAGPDGAVGIAGAASGGDILFHEVCEELGVPTRLFLALPPEPYIAASVAAAGNGWVRRFWAIKDRHPVASILAQSDELPAWLGHREPYSVWQRNNLWTLNEALAAGARHVTVLALWNRQAGDGPGGTADMIAIARGRGADVHVIDASEL
jgi:hypothetical protein